MKNGPKIAIVVVCLVAAAVLLLFNLGIIGGGGSSASNGATAQPIQAQPGSNAAPVDPKTGEVEIGTGRPTRAR